MCLPWTFAMAFENADLSKDLTILTNTSSTCAYVLYIGSQMM